MRPKEHRVDLTDTERAELLLLTRAGTAKAQVIRRAHILLRASEDAFDAETAQALHVSPATVHRVRRRFATAPASERVERALYDRHRPGATRKLDAKQEAFLIALACSDAPEGRIHWTMQLLADKLVELHVIEAISDETVRRTLGEKSAQAVAAAALVHGDGRGRLRLAHGRRLGSLRRTARSHPSPGLLR